MVVASLAMGAGVVKNAWQWLCRKCNRKNADGNGHCWACGAKRGKS